MKRLPFFLFFSVAVLLISCERVKNKYEEVGTKAIEHVTATKDNIEDHIIAHYDSYAPDTKWNKKRFQEFFGFEPGTEVARIYCYANEMGIDHTYAFSFVCDKKIVDSIVTKLNLTKNNSSPQTRVTLPKLGWWDEQKIDTITPYYRHSEHATYEYLWYDTPTSTVYYLLFDL